MNQKKELAKQEKQGLVKHKKWEKEKLEKYRRKSCQKGSSAGEAGEGRICEAKKYKELVEQEEVKKRSNRSNYL